MTGFIEFGYSYYLVIALAAMSFVIAILNLRFLESLGTSLIVMNEDHLTRVVSVLIPARNEQENIGKCLRALMAQDHEALEILVLDDKSTDRTSEIILFLAGEDVRIRIVPGKELPRGWVGKNWACHQLAAEAVGDFLLFVDADTILAPGTISAALHESITREVDLLTVMPRRTAGCITERLLFPFMDWASFAWMPMKTAHATSNPHLSATFGQFILFERNAYRVIGGHEAIYDNLFDDFELGRLTKTKGLKWMLFDGANWVHVLAYKGNADAFKAVSRSVFPAIYYRVSVLTVLSIVVMGLGFLPPVTLLVSVFSHPVEPRFLLAATVSIVLVAVPWLILSRKFKHSTLLVPLYPLSMGLMLAVGFHSMVTHGLGLTTWKGRRVGKRRIRL
jgi:chlorobactene glucosyltransferase